MVTEWRQDMIVHENLNMNTALFSLEEINTAIGKLKRHKTPGPDTIPVEFFKEMTEDSLE